MTRRPNAVLRHILPPWSAACFLLAVGICRAQLYTVSTFAGGAPPPTPVAAVNASIGQPSGVAVDGAGNLYIMSDNCVFKVDASGQMTRFAGTSRGGYLGDGGPATAAELYAPTSMAFDSAGNAYIGDSINRLVRKISPNGTITTVAGGGGTPYPDQDGIAATSAAIEPPLGVAVDHQGTVYFSEADRVRKFSSNGVIQTAAGNGTRGYSGDGGSATSAKVNFPYGLVFDHAGNLYFSDSSNNVIRKVTPAGIISTLSTPQLANPAGLAMDAAGNLYIAVQGSINSVPNNVNLILKVSPSGAVTTVAGNGTGGFSGDGGPATSAELNGPSGVAIDAQGNLYIADTLNNRVRKVTPDGTISTVAGNGTSLYSGDGGPAVAAQLSGPRGLALDAGGDLFIADTGNNVVRKISASGTIITVAGNGTPGFSGDGGQATAAQLNSPAGVAVDGNGNVFISDTANERVRKVSANGVITTYAGNGSSPPESMNPITVGDGGLATGAELSTPLGLAVDAAGNLYIADSQDNAIRKVATNGIITTAASGGFFVAGGSGLEPGIPSSVAVDSAGNLFITSGATTMTQQGPGQKNTYLRGSAVAIDGSDNAFLAGVCITRIDKVLPNGADTPIAGSCNLNTEYAGDGGPALDAQFGSGMETAVVGPQGIAVDAAGNIYVADTGNNAVRVLKPTNKSALIGAVVDVASETNLPVSPGKIVAIYGWGLGNAQLVQYQVGPNGQRIGTNLSGTTVSFNGIPAPVIFSSVSQVAAIVPYEISGETADVTVTFNGATTESVAVPIAASAPSLFTLNETGAGQASALNADGTINTAANPAKTGSVITLYATGEGETSPAGSDGKIASNPLPHPVLPVSATIDGQSAKVVYSGAIAGGVEGLMVAQVEIPSGVQPGGYVPVEIRVGPASSQGGVTIAVAQ
jgi:trimeric autotransporter adhesin